MSFTPFAFGQPIQWKIHVHTEHIHTDPAPPTTTKTTADSEDDHAMSEDRHFLISITPTATLQELLQIASSTYESIYQREITFTRIRHSSGADLSPKGIVADFLVYQDHVCLSPAGRSFPPFAQIPAQFAPGPSLLDLQTTQLSLALHQSYQLHQSLANTQSDASRKRTRSQSPPSKPQAEPASSSFKTPTRPLPSTSADSKSAVKPPLAAVQSAITPSSKLADKKPKKADLENSAKVQKRVSSSEATATAASTPASPFSRFRLKKNDSATPKTHDESSNDEGKASSSQEQPDAAASDDVEADTKADKSVAVNKKGLVKDLKFKQQKITGIEKDDAVKTKKEKTGPVGTISAAAAAVAGGKTDSIASPNPRKIESTRHKDASLNSASTAKGVALAEAEFTQKKGFETPKGHSQAAPKGIAPTITSDSALANQSANKQTGATFESPSDFLSTEATQDHKPPSSSQVGGTMKDSTGGQSQANRKDDTVSGEYDSSVGQVPTALSAAITKANAGKSAEVAVNLSQTNNDSVKKSKGQDIAEVTQGAKKSPSFTGLRKQIQDDEDSESESTSDNESNKAAQAKSRDNLHESKKAGHVLVTAAETGKKQSPASKTEVVQPSIITKSNKPLPAPITPKNSNDQDDESSGSEESLEGNTGVNQLQKGENVSLPNLNIKNEQPKQKLQQQTNTQAAGTQEEKKAKQTSEATTTKKTAAKESTESAANDKAEPRTEIDTRTTSQDKKGTTATTKVTPSPDASKPILEAAPSSQKSASKPPQPSKQQTNIANTSEGVEPTKTESKPVTTPASKRNQESDSSSQSESSDDEDDEKPKTTNAEESVYKGSKGAPKPIKADQTPKTATNTSNTTAASTTATTAANLPNTASKAQKPSGTDANTGSQKQSGVTKNPSQPEQKQGQKPKPQEVKTSRPAADESSDSSSDDDGGNILASMGKDSSAKKPATPAPQPKSTPAPKDLTKKKLPPSPMENLMKKKK